jgi:hypothetical protein
LLQAEACSGAQLVRCAIQRLTAHRGHEIEIRGGFDSARQVWDMRRRVTGARGQIKAKGRAIVLGNVTKVLNMTWRCTSPQRMPSGGSIHGSRDQDAGATALHYTFL